MTRWSAGSPGVSALAPDLLDILWPPLARQDLAKIDRCLADDIGGRIIAAAIFLLDMPLASPATGHGDRRKWRIRGTPYPMFYRVMEGQLRLLRVLCVARDRRDR